MTNSDHQQVLEDVWTKFVDLDEQVMMQELHLESLSRGRSFSVDDRTKLKLTVRRVIEK